MKILSWNCRGLGPSRNVQFLNELVVQKRPNVVFLCETLSNNVKVDRVCRSLGFEGCFVVEDQGRSGGQREFRFTGIHGEPNRSLQKNTWDLLRTFHGRSTAPWSLMGDFNNVLSQGEKLGGLPYPAWLIEGFQEVVQQCGLIDLELCGHPFTWEKSRDSTNWIEVRLDRAMVSNS
uniref:Endonuclease/exonuclease/phosphatase domain-containing protein n=1 Tax=Cannabis sativa TaxID=3483 RepID=A0A803Q5Q7_CANSA